jgi:hypothetical protein
LDPILCHFNAVNVLTGVNDWRDDLKKVLKQAGGHGKETTFLLTESQIKDEVFLQDIDLLLNSGEVPNLYTVDEQQEILEVSCLSVWLYCKLVA